MLEVKAFQTLLASMCLGQGVQAKLPSPRSLAVGGQKVNIAVRTSLGETVPVHRLPAGWLKLERPLQFLSPEISLYGEVSAFD
ncbi:hypothetical protein GRJ2_001816300 [Grus japonensis]|uniref:Uncharacterized protein n=1 Tax=Grus japonensis TaxID=30415 RepID=A0ABC9X739_GRUJA